MGKIHGHTTNTWKSATYNSWEAMWRRVRGDKDSKYYRDRNITVCPEWLTFEGFLVDMGVRPAGTTLDRIDTRGNYHKGNCRWATMQVQQRNKTCSFVTEELYKKIRELKLFSYTHSEIADTLGIKHHHVHNWAWKTDYYQKSTDRVFETKRKRKHI